MQCKIVTKKGARCARDAVKGGLGFCWQHVPAEAKSREKWKTGLEAGALLVGTIELVIKVAELAVKCFPECFGAGDHYQEDRERLTSLLFDGPSLDEDSNDSYKAGARVDWSSLLEFTAEAVWLKNNMLPTPDLRAIIWLNDEFNSWYENLNEYHKGILNEKIEALSDS